MKYNRYTFAELKGDIEASPVQQFTTEDLIPMLTEEPFYLSKYYTTHFLKLCQDGSSKASQITSATLINALRSVIEDFSLLEEDAEEQMLYTIANFMTKHRAALEKEFRTCSKSG